ncbi:hypothetical protein BZL43_09165 [Pseudomonas sp. PICF141]|nr:hypothetical protein BZL43_09165 [Pseudomonas sp. PICF141]
MTSLPWPSLIQQLTQLPTVIEGQMRTPTGLSGACPGIHFLGPIHRLYEQGSGRFQKPGKAIEAT